MVQSNWVLAKWSILIMSRLLFAVDVFYYRRLKYFVFQSARLTMW
jgi:hypothetical protein